MKSPAFSKNAKFTVQNFSLWSVSSDVESSSIEQNREADGWFNQTLPFQVNHIIHQLLIQPVCPRSGMSKLQKLELEKKSVSLKATTFSATGCVTQAISICNNKRTKMEKNVSSKGYAKLSA